MNRSLNEPLRKIIGEIAEVSGFLWSKGWAESNAGNISVDVTEHLPALPARHRGHGLAGRSFLITGAGTRMRDVARFPGKTLLLIEIQGQHAGYKTLWGETGLRPTSELISHLKIHLYLVSHRPAYRAIVHTHPSDLTALSFILDPGSEKETNKILFSTLPEVAIAMPEGIGYAKYACPGTAALARATAKAMRQHRLIIWEKHGATAIGRNVNEAFDLIDIADKAARIFLTCLQGGHEPRGLSRKQQEEIARRFGNASPLRKKRPQRTRQRIENNRASGHY